MAGVTGQPSSTGLQYRTRVLAIAAALAWPGIALPGISAAMAAEHQNAAHQKTFASPEEAADALVAAARAGKTGELEAILGPASRKLVFSGDPVADREGREKFVSDYEQKHGIDRQTDTVAVVLISADEWPFPIPIVKQGDTWSFDTKAGADEILNRRIGRNELNAIQVCGAIVDAQREYANEDHTGKGYLEYAQRFLSSPGKRDGLYWPTATADDESPIGPLVASARAEGYAPGTHHGRRTPYHGYYYKILTRQDKDAPGGAYNYIVNGHMIGGFALVAFPATYGDSGVMTFIVNQDGVVYEKNLGPDTKDIAGRMTAFNPDSSWKPHK
jgi:DUF2950 family protein